MGDVVVEAAGEGFDLIRTTLEGYVLGTDLEGLVLEGTQSLSGYGNALDNVLIGNTGANLLQGEDGNDTLAGWRGNDWLPSSRRSPTRWLPMQRPSPLNFSQPKDHRSTSVAIT